VAKDWEKKTHSESLSALLCLAHVLPQACKSKRIIRYIFLREDRIERWQDMQSFHADFTLDGWNDHIIQPARDAVLNYYKVRTPCLIYAVLTLIPIQPYFIYYLNQRYAEPSDLEEYIRVNNLS